MALTLGEAETRLRTLTRHTQDTRLSQVSAWDLLNAAYRDMRAELREVAPELYLDVSSDIVLTDDDGNEIVLADDDVNFDNLYMVERYDDTVSRWRPIERASTLDPAQSYHQRICFTVEHKCLILHSPPDISTAGTYRVKHHNVPAVLTDANAYFQIPQQLEMPLIWLAVGMVREADGDDGAYESFSERAAKELARVAPSLRNRHGIHPDTGGIRRVQWR